MNKDNAASSVNRVLFCLFEDLPQFVLQTVNNLLIGRTISWVDTLSPIISLISLNKGMLDFSYAFYNRKETGEDETDEEDERFKKTISISCQSCFTVIFMTFATFMAYYYSFENANLKQPDWITTNLADYGMSGNEKAKNVHLLLNNLTKPSVSLHSNNLKKP